MAWHGGQPSGVTPDGMYGPLICVLCPDIVVLALDGTAAVHTARHQVPLSATASSTGRPLAGGRIHSAGRFDIYVRLFRDVNLVGRSLRGVPAALVLLHGEEPQPFYVARDGALWRFRSIAGSVWSAAARPRWSRGRSTSPPASCFPRTYDVSDLACAS